MHQAGTGIMEEGYKHVVSVVNYMDEHNNYQTPATDFLLNLELDLHDPSLVQEEKVWHYNGFECKWTIIDGELPGLGIYVFFKDEAAFRLVEEFVNDFHKQHPKVQ